MAEKRKSVFYYDYCGGGSSSSACGGFGRTIRYSGRQSGRGICGAGSEHGGEEHPPVL